MAQHGDFGDTSVTVCSLSGRVGGRLHYFPSSFSISSTCQVGHLDLEILLSHISSNFCDVFCWTLQKFRKEKKSRGVCSMFCDMLLVNDMLFMRKLSKRKTRGSSLMFCGMLFMRKLSRNFQSVLSG